MLNNLLTGSALLRTPHALLPRTCYRYKSITAAIERGRQGGPDRAFRSRTRTTNDAPPTREKTRRELRFERFGPARDDGEPSTAPREERPQRSRSESVSGSRSSRFGRVGPARPRGDAPSRFPEEKLARDQDAAPQRRREDRPERSSDRAPARGRFDRDRGSASNSFKEERRTSRSRRDDGAPQQDRFPDRGERPAGRERFGGPREERSFESSKSYDKPRNNFSDRSNTDRPRRDFGGDRDQMRSERSERSERPSRRDDDTRSYEPRERYNTDERPGKPRFTQRPDSKGARREGEQSARYTSREGSDRPAHTSTGSAAPKEFTRAPESLPFTTAASEFIYGYSSVLAAIKANRRKFYTLYVHSRGASRDGLMAKIRAHKLFSITKEVGDEYMRALDKASSGRPHNGVVLESSPLPVSPITELKTPSIADSSFSVSLDTQSAEDALVNGKQEIYPYKSGGWRNPLILYVDGVVSTPFPLTIPILHLTNKQQ